MLNLMLYESTRQNIEIWKFDPLSTFESWSNAILATGWLWKPGPYSDNFWHGLGLPNTTRMLLSEQRACDRNIRGECPRPIVDCLCEGITQGSMVKLTRCTHSSLVLTLAGPPTPFITFSVLGSRFHQPITAPDSLHPRYFTSSHSPSPSITPSPCNWDDRGKEEGRVQGIENGIGQERKGRKARKERSRRGQRESFPFL